MIFRSFVCSFVSSFVSSFVRYCRSFANWFACFNILVDFWRHINAWTCMFIWFTVFECWPEMKTRGPWTGRDVWTASADKPESLRCGHNVGSSVACSWIYITGKYWPQTIISDWVNCLRSRQQSVVISCAFILHMLLTNCVWCLNLKNIVFVIGVNICTHCSVEIGKGRYICIFLSFWWLDLS